MATFYCQKLKTGAVTASGSLSAHKLKATNDVHELVSNDQVALKTDAAQSALVEVSLPLLTANATLALKSDIPDTTNYLPLTGGTLTGTLSAPTISCGDVSYYAASTNRTYEGFKWYTGFQDMATYGGVQYAGARVSSTGAPYFSAEFALFPVNPDLSLETTISSFSKNGTYPFVDMIAYINGFTSFEFKIIAYYQTWEMYTVKGWQTIDNTGQKTIKFDQNDTNATTLIQIKADSTTASLYNLVNILPGTAGSNLVKFTAKLKFINGITS